MKFTKDVDGESRSQLVLPKEFRPRGLKLAHEKCGHFGRKEVVQVIQTSFCWPGLIRDLNDHCRSCKDCQKFNKSGLVRGPMVAREIVTVSFERVCIDLVGPLSKSKGGYQYLLT